MELPDFPLALSSSSHGIMVSSLSDDVERVIYKKYTYAQDCILLHKVITLIDPKAFRGGNTIMSCPGNIFFGKLYTILISRKKFSLKTSNNTTFAIIFRIFFMAQNFLKIYKIYIWRHYDDWSQVVTQHSRSALF